MPPLQLLPLLPPPCTTRHLPSARAAALAVCPLPAARGAPAPAPSDTLVLPAPVAGPPCLLSLAALQLNEYCRSIGISHSTIQLVVNGCACPCAS